MTNRFPIDYTSNKPFLGNPLNIRNDFSAFAVRPFDANHVGVSGIGINSINATTHIMQLIPLTKRQFVFLNFDKKTIKRKLNFNPTIQMSNNLPV